MMTDHEAVAHPVRSPMGSPAPESSALATGPPAPSSNTHDKDAYRGCSGLMMHKPHSASPEATQPKAHKV
jgi:hypothetical protein